MFNMIKGMGLSHCKASELPVEKMIIDKTVNKHYVSSGSLARDMSTKNVYTWCMFIWSSEYMQSILFKNFINLYSEKSIFVKY